VDVHALALPRAIPRERAAKTVSPWVVAAVVAVAYAVLIAPGLARDPFQFINLSHKFVTWGTTSGVIDSSAAHAHKEGYDGQFYYFLAVDPAHGKDYMEQPGTVYSRIGYPMTVRALSGGNASLIPYLMILVNLAAAVGGTLAVAFILKRKQVSPWFALVYGFFPGLIVAVLRDLTEPLAFGLAAAGLAVFDPRSKKRLFLSAGLFGLALLTRETVALFPALLAAGLLVGMGGAAKNWRDRLRFGNLARAVAFAEIAFAPLFIWRHIVGIWLNHPQIQESLATGSGGKAAASSFLPFNGQVGQWPWSGENVADLFVVVLPALVWAAIAVGLLRRRWGLEPFFVLANVLVFVVLLPTSVCVDYGGMGRSAIGIVLAVLVALPLVTTYFADRSRTALSAVALWTLPYYLLFAVPLVFVGPKYIW
jgi:hypothetical protein